MTAARRLSWLTRICGHVRHHAGGLLHLVPSARRNIYHARFISPTWTLPHRVSSGSNATTAVAPDKVTWRGANRSR